MNHATAYSDCVHPDALRTDPRPDEIATVAAKILTHLEANPEEWADSLKEALDNTHVAGLGDALHTGDLLEAGRLAREAAKAQLSDDATELAERYLNDDLTSWDQLRLAEWAPVKYACLGKRYHLTGMLG